jgi:hypothetical protein
MRKYEMSVPNYEALTFIKVQYDADILYGNSRKLYFTKSVYVMFIYGIFKSVSIVNFA